jgi:hypothetical protein
MTTDPTPEEDHRELLNRLFASATAMLEEAIDISVAGQSPCRSAQDLECYAHHLTAIARGIAIVSEAAKVIARSGTAHESEVSESSG